MVVDVGGQETSGGHLGWLNQASHAEAACLQFLSIVFRFALARRTLSGSTARILRLLCFASVRWLGHLLPTVPARRLNARRSEERRARYE
jgi:hypothetical protein